jgi:hypothetical protein
MPLSRYNADPEGLLKADRLDTVQFRAAMVLFIKPRPPLRYDAPEFPEQACTKHGTGSATDHKVQFDQFQGFVLMHRGCLNKQTSFYPSISGYYMAEV